MDTRNFFEINHGVFLIKLPEGSTPGRFEAADDFARSFGELKRRYPNKTLSLTVFSMVDGNATAWLVVVQ